MCINNKRFSKKKNNNITLDNTNLKIKQSFRNLFSHVKKLMSNAHFYILCLNVFQSNLLKPPIIFFKKKNGNSSSINLLIKNLNKMVFQYACVCNKKLKQMPWVIPYPWTKDKIKSIC